jgi:GDP-D-mannose 3', 5'-epimerase
MKRVLILGAGGFIGNHLVTRLKKDGCFVVGIDLKYPEFNATKADEFVVGDLRDLQFCISQINNSFDEIYQLAADMGGAGYLFTGENDFSVMRNSVSINLNVLYCLQNNTTTKLFFASSACIYPKHNQSDYNNPLCTEYSAYPADPDSEYGWEKLFSERLYLAAHRNTNLQVRIARFHNVYGPLGAFNNGKEKAPAALCRKIAEAEDGGIIEIWGTGQQTRSFLYIDDCIDGILKLMQSNYTEPVNIGSEELISLHDFALLISKIAEKTITIKNIDGPVGVNGRVSDNTLIRNVCGWKPKYDLKSGMTLTYNWITERVLLKLNA